MISSRTSKDLGFPTPSTTPTNPPLTPPSSHPSLSTRLLQHPARHLRGLVQLAHQRHLLALALGIGTAAGLGTAATVGSLHLLHTAHVQPLAPAPAPLAATATPAARPKLKHRLLAAIAATHPLRGIASWYGSVLHGHTTASGEIFDESMMTACHRTLPFGTMVRVTDEASAKSVVVRINDRGVLNADRVIDLSTAAATKLGILRSGVAHVRLEVLTAKPAAATQQAIQAD